MTLAQEALERLKAMAPTPYVRVRVRVGVDLRFDFVVVMVGIEAGLGCERVRRWRRRHYSG